MSQHTKKEKELADYFKENKEFKRLLISIKDKYESYGDFKGILKIEKISMEEKRAISGITGESYTGDDISIKTEKFLLFLQNTRFSGVNFLEVLNLYFGYEITFKKERVEKEQKERERFFKDIYEWHSGTNGGKWLKESLENKNGAYNIIIKEYNLLKNREDKIRFEKIIETVIKAVNSISKDKKEYIFLPVFAVNLSGNPHFFDIENLEGKLLLHALSYIYGKNYPSNAEERAEIYMEFGLLIDEISNNTAISGIRAIKDGLYKKSWDNFIDEREYFLLPFSGIVNVDKIDTFLKKIFIFENPAVFSYVFNYFKKKKNIVIPMICGYGQIKLTTLLLMDKAVKNGIKLYYSGDIDPEGLLIADRLKKRYNENFNLILYDEEIIEKYLSGVEITETSMKKCDNLENDILIKASNVIKRTNKKCFQESFLTELTEKIEDLL